MIEKYQGEDTTETIAFSVGEGCYVLAIDHTGRALVQDENGDAVETDDPIEIRSALMYFLLDNPENVRSLVQYIGESLALTRLIRAKVDTNRRHRSGELN